MTEKLEKYIVYLFAAVAAGVFLYWFTYDPVKDLQRHEPGLDNRPPKSESSNEQVLIGEKFSTYAEHESTLTGKWTNFRGQDFDNINKENIPLIDNWQPEPTILWEVLLGEGHAAPAIYNGRVYLLDYDEAKKADALRCFALETGQELWKRSYNVQVKRNHGMSRTIPAVTDKYVLTIGPRGHVMCADSKNGDLLWGIDLVETYGTEIPFWYTGQCPFIDGDVAVIAPGGSALMIGVDCASGEVLWEAPNPDGWKMSHSSVIPMEFGGKKMYVYAAVGGICGISAERGEAGKLLWKTREFAPAVVAPSPVILEDGKIFMTAGYGAGAAMLQLIQDGDQLGVKILQTYKPRDGMASEQQTPLLVDGKLVAILPKGAGGFRNQLVCCDPADCTEYLWTSGKEERFGLGPYILADGKIFILDDDGTLNIGRITGHGLQILDRARIIEGHDAWGPIAIADGYLLMRDAKKMVCLDVRKNR